MKLGAVDFLTKPVDEAELISAVAAASAMNRQQSDREADVQSTLERFASLSRREGEVLRMLVKGRLNKQIAADLGITEKTVKVTRQHCMTKMGVRSVARLVSKLMRSGLDVENLPEG